MSLFGNKVLFAVIVCTLIVQFIVFYGSNIFTPFADVKGQASHCRTQAEPTNRTSSLDGNDTFLFYEHYQPAPVEAYVVENSQRLGYQSEANPPGCNIWVNKSLTPIYDDLLRFKREMEEYQKRLLNMTKMEDDLRTLIEKDGYDVCHKVEVHPDGLPAIFTSRQLSLTRAGWVEPLLPPMRHPGICFGRVIPKLMDMEYMVHDFGSMCRKLRKTSRTVLIDMGASLDFHSGMKSPAVYVTELYHKFGFRFDHIYAFEISEKKPQDVYERVPDELMASYHWINIGVNPEKGHRFNPLSSILRGFDKDDFVIIKLDVDTAAVEVPLAHQILEEASLYDMIDQFYFEHHVHLGELSPFWRTSMVGTIDQSLNLFQALRKKGVASHFWP